MPAQSSPVDEPIRNFTDCHAGIFGQLERLAALPALLDPARQARAIASESRRFFRSAMFEHHAEEEQELFPAVLASARRGDERGRVTSIVERLTREHRRLEQAFAALEPALKRLAAGHDAELDAAAVAALARDYAAHARYEESEFLPLAQQILGRDGNHLAALGMSLHLRHAVPEFIGRYGSRV